jgi:rhamnopyranosyl-N-acetylglucosaminyl-diphospho-decaprenol beta-1,3/1,4-galactofuranosyltransferase
LTVQLTRICQVRVTPDQLAAAWSRPERPCSTDKIILIGNASTDDAPQLLEELGYLGNALIKYVRLPQNLGGARGFYAGIKRDHQSGYDRLWVMDDDAEPEPSAAGFLCRSEAIDSPETVGAACKKIGKSARIQAHHRARVGESQDLIPVHEYAEEQVRIDHSSFVGLAIRSSVITTAGLLRQDVLIWCDDIEYRLRMGQQGEIWRISGSIIRHKDDSVPRERR